MDLRPKHKETFNGAAASIVLKSTEPQIVRGLVIQFDNDFLSLLDRAYLMRSDRHGQYKPCVTEEFPMEGTIFYVNPETTPMALRKHLQVGQQVTIRTYLPLNQPTGGTMVFESLKIQAFDLPVSGETFLSIQDTRTPDQIPGTPEYIQHVYDTLHPKY